MLLGPLTTRCPFDVPDVFWCETRFAVSDMTDVQQDGLCIGLPDDLVSAVPKRRSEFLAGRFCATVALRAAGVQGDIGRSGRAPVWPAGIVGSITHSQSRAVAAVSRRHGFLGLDCEEIMAEARATSLAPALIGEAEAALRPGAMAFGAFLTLVFSAKEAVYKARSHSLNRVPDFLEAQLTDIGHDTLGITLHGAPHRVRYRVTADDCLTLVLG